MRRALPLLALVATAGALAACAEKADTTVKVTGTDDACTADVATVDAGKITFAFTNEAGDVNELYVVRADGSVASEVENVTTGTTRNLTATLDAGTYTLTCKPGMTGDGISSTIEVTGQGGGSAAPAADRDVEVVATEYAFTPKGDLSVAKGDTVSITLANEGTMEHELEVFDPDGTALGEVAPIKPGTTGAVAVTFAEAGTYRFVCGIEGHEANGMVLDVTVS
jgi:iron uptake system component EfeO